MKNNPFTAPPGLIRDAAAVADVPPQTVSGENRSLIYSILATPTAT